MKELCGEELTKGAHEDTYIRPKGRDSKMQDNKVLKYINRSTVGERRELVKKEAIKLAISPFPLILRARPGRAHVYEYLACL